MMVSFLRFALAVLVSCLLATEASAHHLHYVELIADPNWVPDIITNTGNEDPVNQWVIAAGENDEQYYIRNGTTVSYFRPEGVPVSSTISIFGHPTFADSTNPRTTAYYEFEVSVLADTATDSLEIGFTDIVNFLKFDEAENAIRSDEEPSNIAFAPTWSTLGTLPYRIRFYYHFADFTVTAVIVDDVLGTSAPMSWQGNINPFANFFGMIGGTHPVNLDIYPFVSCQVDCTITTLAWDVLECDTANGHVDTASCKLCGDGIIVGDEQCDDGNTLDGDGCSATCALEKEGRLCQEAIYRASRRYAMQRHKSLLKCRQSLLKGKSLFADDAKTQAVTERSQCATETRTARAIANAGAGVRKTIAKEPKPKCTDTLVAGLRACATTVDGLVSADGQSGCLLTTHDAAIDQMLDAAGPD